MPHIFRSAFFLLLLGAGLTRAGEFRVVPEAPHQGDLLQIFGTPACRQVRLHGKTVSLYPQSSQTSPLGLIAVPVAIHPGAYPLEWLDEHGNVLHSLELDVRDAHYRIQNVELSPALANLHASTDERQEVSRFFDKDSALRSWKLPILSPVHGCLTSPFGVQRAHNGKLTGDIHSGIDQRGALGTPIRAAAAGEVTLAGQFDLHGGTVGVDHGQGLKSMYLHMSKIAVQPGVSVSAGDIIGYVGSTGRSTGPHLHWALYAHGEPVNPLQWLDLAPCGPKPAPAKSVHPRRPAETAA